MKVLIKGNYNIETYFSQTPGNSGFWNDMELVTDTKQCDVLIVFNKPLTDINVKCRKGGRWLIIQEPPYKKNEYLRDYFKYFDLVISGFEDNSTNRLNIPALLPWHIGLNYDQLNLLNNSLTSKKNKVVWITSSSNVNPGHSPRLNFLEHLYKSDINYEVYGRGIREVSKKIDVLEDAKYSIAIENYSAKDYWTEKIADAFLALTIPFYFGCENLDKYFPKNSFVAIDINKPNRALDHMKEIMNSDYFDLNLSALLEARELVLKKYNLLPFIQDSLIERLEDKYINTFIPADPSLITSKIKNILINKI